MNKKIITALVALSIVIPTTAYADLNNNSNPTIAILDTGLDMSLPEFKDKVVYEVCITEWAGCPNNKNYMEGPGSSVIPSKFISSGGLDHGTQMVSAAIQTNPNVRIVFVRIIGTSPNGSPQLNVTESTFTNALNWVLNNKDKFNIQAISLAQVNYSPLPGANYCRNTPSTQNLIKSLSVSGIPFFAAAGNNQDYKRISWPACISDTVAIGATMDGDVIYTKGNADPNLLDFYALGSMRLKTVGNKDVNVVGTSIATQVAAVVWASYKFKNQSMSYQDIYNKLVSTSIPVSGRGGVSGKLIDKDGLINGK